MNPSFQLKPNPPDVNVWVLVVVVVSCPVITVCMAEPRHLDQGEGGRVICQCEGGCQQDVGVAETGGRQVGGGWGLYDLDVEWR